MAGEPETFVAVLRRRAAEQPSDRAFIFLPDRGGEPVALSYRELYARAGKLARTLAERGRKGERAALVFAPGLDFVVAFFGCLLAGIVAVPMMIPRRDARRDASGAILADCTPRFAIGSRDLLAASRPDLAARFAGPALEWVLLDAAPEAADGDDLPEPARGDVALLQYTSGSTSAPKGVVVSHANLVENARMIRLAFGNTRRSTFAGWVPLYHDMGLILNVLQPLYLGAPGVLMAPVAFLQRPLKWLRAISDYRAEVAGGPNFAYDLCVRRHRPQEMAGIDLSSWKLAYCGAEPVRAETLARFAATFAPYGFSAGAPYPAYGMAEATLLISGGRRGAGPVMRAVSRTALQQRGRAEPPRDEGDAHTLVGCGRVLAGERLAIVDPDSRRRLGANALGEIWAGGPHIAQGYWRNEAASAQTFQARIDGDGLEGWLRTGDLGFLDEAGELYITGRIKDLVIIRGINHYPQDIERTVEECHPALRRHAGAAFAVAEPAGDERLVVVQEIERGALRRFAAEAVVAAIREALAREHDLAAHRIVLIRPGSLPQTTSGKIQRSLTRRLWLAGSLPDAAAP